MLQGLKIQLFETKRLTKDGRILDIQLSSSLFFGRDEKPVGNIVILRDVTAQKRAEEILRTAHDELEQRVKERTAELVLLNENLQQEIVDRQHAEAEIVKSKAMFKAVIESLPFDAFVLDLDNRYILQNSICKKSWGDVIGKSPEDLPVNEKTKYLWMDNNRRALSGETVAGEVVYDRLDGGKNFYYNIIAPICDGKEILGIVGVLVDISDLKQAEEALKESEEKLKEIFERSRDAIFITSSDSRFVKVNEAARHLSGYSGQELLTMSIPDLHEEKDLHAFHEFFERIIAGEPVTSEAKILRKDGSKVDTEFSNARIFIGETPFMHTTARDITKRKRTEKELRKAHDELESRVAERTRELKIEKGNLEEANIALQVLLEKRQEDKKEIADNVLTNVKELVAPYFEKIKKKKLDDQQKAILNIIEYNLNEIISPFARKMSQKYLNLTPTEIQVANLIRHGSDSKEIADLMGLSPRTIYNHRKNIRKKFGLENKKTNLRSHLLSTY
jgi:PAS domain S-box-containing protein